MTSVDAGHQSENRATRRDRIHGLLLGGAAGDALGAAVEFMTLQRIRAEFGDPGILDFAPAYGRVGAITDDTQMSMFTAEALLRIASVEPRTADPVQVTWNAYRRWLRTQDPRSPAPAHLDSAHSWLFGVPELHDQRAPGNTCMSAMYGSSPGTVEQRINDSKGCGGVMRVAPVAVLPWSEPFADGVSVAAITHGHPSGFLAAGALAHMLHAILDGSGVSAASTGALERLAREPGHEETSEALRQALAATAEGNPSAERLEKLGAGWVAEEALAISVYCALVYENDFAAGVRLAVNHSGDSDSTGAITGNILGARLGVGAIPERWLAELELRAELETLAEDLTIGRVDSEEWGARYPHS